MTLTPPLPNPTYDSEKDHKGIAKPVAAATASVLLLVLILLAAFCIFNQRQTQPQGRQDEPCIDVNPVYGDYEIPDPIAEVEDTNDYYSSDYEAESGTSRTTENNPYYE